MSNEYYKKYKPKKLSDILHSNVDVKNIKPIIIPNGARGTGKVLNVYKLKEIAEQSKK